VNVWSCTKVRSQNAHSCDTVMSNSPVTQVTQSESTMVISTSRAESLSSLHGIPSNSSPYTTWIQRGHTILELHYVDDEFEAVKDELNKVYYIYIYCYTKVPNCVCCHVTVRQV